MPKHKPFKLTIPHIVGTITILTVTTGLVIKYGGLPEGLAYVQAQVREQEKELQEYRNDVTALQTQQTALMNQTDKIYELLKQRSN